MNETTLDYVRVITEADMLAGVHQHLEPVMRTPMEGGVIVHAGSTTCELLCQYLNNPGDASYRVTHEPLLEVPAGLKSEMLYYVADSAAAYRILEASKSARAYVLALTYIPWPGAPDKDDRDELDEFQAVVRVIQAKNECFDILAELGIETRS